LIEDNGFKFVKLKEINESKPKKINKKIMTIEKQMYFLLDKNSIKAAVENEIEAFKNEGIDLVVSSFRPTCSISSRVLKIPLVILISGTANSLYYRSGFATFPENYENAFTKMLPTWFKKYITRWILLNNKFLVKEFNWVAKKYDIKTFRTLNDIHEGDYTLFCDDINFLGLKPTKKFPIENFIGPVSLGFSDNQSDELDEDIKKHLERPGKSILLIMGSMPMKKLFIKILELLNLTNYNVIAVYTSMSTEGFPKTNENILLKEYIKSPQIVNKMVDLAIIHGGRGTVYNAAYSGKPAIGIPIHIEQQYNIDCLVRHGTGLRLSKKFFKTEDLKQAIDTIFNNYDTFLKNAQELSSKLYKGPMEEKVVKRLMDILEEKKQ
jgi:UDP:flavonoid glycosyltransferase YjiC (YdhE family)